MPKHKILEQAPLALREVHDALEQIKERDKELNFRAQKTLEYIQQVGPVKPAAAKKLFKALQELEGARLKDVHCQKLIDLAPKTAEEVKVAMQGYSVPLSKDAFGKIAELIAEHAKE